jgi:CHAT domain-containing protein
MRRIGLRNFAAAVLLLASGFLPWPQAFAQTDSKHEAKAVLVYVDKTGAPRIVEVDCADLTVSVTGLLVWPVGDDAERWAIVSPGWQMPSEDGLLTASDGPIPGTTRGGSLGGPGPDASQFTMQLAQINPDTSTRNIGVYPLTPAAEGRLLNPRPTFRRLPLEKEPRFPAVAAVITSDLLSKPLRIEFAQGKDRVGWDELKGLPAEAKAGLPAGRYIFGPEKGTDGAFVTFLVEDAAERTQVLQPIDAMSSLLKDRASPLLVQFGLEHLLKKKFRGENDAPLYLSDALDLVESIPASNLTPHLRRQHDLLLRCLQAEPGKRGEALAAVVAGGDDTKILELEQVRQWIASSAWRQALQVLDSPALVRKAAADARVAGLALLYRGVVLAESGLAYEAETRAAFEAAVDKLGKASPADRFRARVNYGNFLQRTAHDRLHNHALQMAAGVSQPILTAMRALAAARVQYEAAQKLADDMHSPAQKAAVQVNVARLYALLDDFIHVLGDGSPGAEPFAGAKAAAAEADRIALEVAQSSAAEGQVRGVAEDIRAMLAFRAGRDADAAAAAGQALSFYLEAGHLAGAENVYRVLGLLAMRRGGAAGRSDALAKFQVAELISESLRERFPPGSGGLTRAGFFARKAFVSEKIVELLLADNRPVEALHHLELARARGLQDLLAARNLPANAPVPSVRQALEKWPADVSAVEYFLGAEQAYVFVVAPGGKVTAHPLLDREGKLLASRDLITRVRKVLRDMEGQAGKMLRRLSARRGYDNSWQEELHRLWYELLPASARKEMHGARTVVFVPQHILHYFPFAALVTEVDGKATKAKMARPRFLVDEEFDIVYAPSLASWRRLPAAQARQVWGVGVSDAPGAPALEGVKKDIANLKAVFGASVKGVIDGDDARESAVKKLLNQRGLLFFATHGLNLADQPLESHLMLLPDEGEMPTNTLEANDGRLTAAELFARKINADLVIMSACYSGLGDRSPLPGDDLFGLQRAFLQSGVRTVVSGLWDVYDGTAPDLMLDMFNGLAGGKTVVASLADSQRNFLSKLRDSGQDEPWLHPYFWAVYTAAGDDRTRFEK